MGAEDDPLDAQAVRKARTNRDIINLCSTRLPMWAHPSAQGIGLFTHVAGPKLVSKNPHVSYSDRVEKEVALLPLGGPKKMAPSKTRRPPDEELAAIYKEVQVAVADEERIWKEMRAAAESRGEAPKDAYKMSLDTLIAKYGSINDAMLNPPTGSRPTDKRRQSDSTVAMNDEAGKRGRVSIASETELQRQSIGAVPETGGASDAARRGSGRRASNEYDVYRDPRRQGR